MHLYKIRIKNNIPADAGYFLRTEIDPIHFKNKNLTAKIRRYMAEKNIFFFKENIPKDLETDETIRQNKK